LDDIAITNEVVDGAKKRKNELLLFKVDLTTYDSVEYKYLEVDMIKIGFPYRLCCWIMECVRIATTSILVNGSPTNEFILRKGLHQGDLFSPFLFLIVVEGLNVVLNSFVDAGLFTSYDVGVDSSFCISNVQVWVRRVKVISDH